MLPFCTKVRLNYSYTVNITQHLGERVFKETAFGALFFRPITANVSRLLANIVV